MESIKLIHGAGGEDTLNLIEKFILPLIGSGLTGEMDDAAYLNLGSDGVAFTTDSHVVKPVFFPGGDIGKLAVCGTVNDLVVCGARPVAMSLGLIVEDGFSAGDLERILKSIGQEADKAGVKIVTGDTKVVEKGAVDGIFINTAAVGILENKIKLGLNYIGPNDDVLVTGGIGRHGVAVLLARHDLGMDVKIESDVACLGGLLLPLVKGKGIKFMRDPTRGGVASVLNEICRDGHFGVEITEEDIPVDDDVAAVSEILGLDPLSIACEGRAVCVCDPRHTEEVLRLLKNHPMGKNASVIGKITSGNKGRVVLNTLGGGRRMVPFPDLEQLPRIC